jgi:hypothetical protein
MKKTLFIITMAILAFYAGQSLACSRNNSLFATSDAQGKKQAVHRPATGPLTPVIGAQ